MARSRPFLQIPGIVLTAVLAAGLALSAVNPAIRQAPSEDLRTGAWAAAYERDYERQLPLRRFAIMTRALARYLLFKEGEDGLVIGNDGWLFTAEELVVGGPHDVSVSDGLTRIGAAHERLAEHGIELIVALIPSKARVYEDRLGRYRMPAALRGRYAGFRRELLDLGIRAPDLLEPLTNARADGEPFFRTDTHWTPYGAEAAAKALSLEAMPILIDRGAERGEFRRETGEKARLDGDLLGFLPLGPFLERVGPRLETVAPMSTVRVDDSAHGLFGDLTVPVVLIGTSYSAGNAWDFGGSLELALQAVVLNLAGEGEGPFAPMEELFRQEIAERARPVLVIWEIPERYVSTPAPSSH